MSRIGSLGSLSSSQLSAINRIQQLSAAITQNTKRLSTLKRINSAKDDPSGLIQATILERELTAAKEASSGVTRASAILSTADTAASEIVTQLQQARTLALQAVGSSSTLTSSQVAANQVQIDAILTSINKQAGTEFAGRRLLDGSSSFDVTGVDSTKIQNVDVLDKNSSAAVIVSINVTQQAAKATDTFTGSIGTDTTLVVTGKRGTTTLTLSSGATDQNIVDAFNGVSELTGITAAIDGADVDFTSTDYGSKAVIQISATTGTFATTGSNSVAGTDAIATINSKTVTGEGSTFSLNSSSLSAVIEVDPTASGTISSFTVSGDGLKFVVGPSASSMARIGLPSLNTARLGGTVGRLSSIGSGGANSLTGSNAANAVLIIDDAIADVTRAQAVMGGFKKFTLDSASRILTSTITNTQSALSAVQDADLALETALLSNNKLLQQTAFQALSISSLQNSEVLSLLKTTAARF